MSEQDDKGLPPHVGAVISKVLQIWHGAPCTWVLVAMRPADVEIVKKYAEGNAAELAVPRIFIGHDNCTVEFAEQMLVHASAMAAAAVIVKTGAKH